jgi:hypothetical protein
MRGDDKTRFCDHCRLQVKNLTAMSRREVAATMLRSETEHVCVTYTRRADGSMVMRWDSICYFFFGPVRRGLAWLLAASVPILVSACQTQDTIAGRVTPTGNCKPPPPKQTHTAEVERVIVTGGI